MKAMPSGLFKVLTMTVIVGLLAIGCASSQSPRSAGRGSVAFVVSKLPQVDRGDLTVMDLASGKVQVVASNVGASELPSASPIGESRVPTVIYGRGDTSDPILLVDTASGKTDEIGFGHGPTLGPDDQLAYCDLDGRIVVARVGTKTSPTVVADIKTFTSCIPLAWSTGGELAFVADTPLGARGADGRPALFIWRRGAAIRELALPSSPGGRVADVRGVGAGVLALIWAEDRSKIAVMTDEATVTVQASAGVAAVKHWGGQPAISPASQNVVAVYSLGHGIEVYEGDAMVATMAVDGPGAIFSWSTDGDALAVSTGHRLALWKWRTNEVSTLRQVPGDHLILGPLLWLKQ